MEIERLGIAVLLAGGFIWLRSRIRNLEEGRRPRALYGSFVMLAAGIILGKWAFQQLSFDSSINLALELSGLAALFLVTAMVFTPFEKRQDRDG